MPSPVLRNQFSIPKNQTDPTIPTKRIRLGFLSKDLIFLIILAWYNIPKPLASSGCDSFNSSVVWINYLWRVASPLSDIVFSNLHFFLHHYAKILFLIWDESIDLDSLFKAKMITYGVWLLWGLKSIGNLLRSGWVVGGIGFGCWRFINVPLKSFLKVKFPRGFEWMLVDNVWIHFHS